MQQLLSSFVPDLPAWVSIMDGNRFLPALSLPCPDGHALFSAHACWEGTQEFPDPTWLRDELRSKHIKGLGEIVNQYLGTAPNDPRLEPYW